ncbi:MAG: class I SAM-dependent methyltransferase [Flavobacteriales bacterium]|jgi:23S rRNA (guanine1835-N2)-methyltransferase|nr:class I SAM-dependent methyltransferase [Flavobacteriales bacterium]
MKTPNQLIIRRYPKSENKSLRSFSAADELIEEYIETENIALRAPVLLNDRFGYLACNFHKFSPISIVNYKSQEKALRQNMLDNSISIIEQNIIFPFDKINHEVEIAIVKVPKSLDLFRLQLQKLSKCLGENSQVICGFMTRHFSKQMLEIAGDYFEEVEQTKAKKKARLIILSKKKKTQSNSLFNEITFGNKTIKQYFGVFSANKIDQATEFFLDNLNVDSSADVILDLASGNGIIAHAIRQQNANAEIHLVDDSYLAVESSKLNLKDENTHHHFSDSLENFTPEFFNLIVSNPPYHFEYETNIEVALDLFKQVHKKLKTSGHFQMVSAVSLNFKTHLTKLFSKVEILAENDKFIVYDCVK